MRISIKKKKRKNKTTKNNIKIPIPCRKLSKLTRSIRYTKILSLIKICLALLYWIRITSKIITKTH